MRVVCDTSVLIAAQIAQAGTCAEILRTILDRHTLVLSKFIYDGFERKLVEKLKFPAKTALFLRRELAALSETVEAVPIESGSCRDATDEMILGTAIGAQAGLLISVDKDLLDLRDFQGIPIIKPGAAFRILTEVS